MTGGDSGGRLKAGAVRWSIVAWAVEVASAGIGKGEGIVAGSGGELPGARGSGVGAEPGGECLGCRREGLEPPAVGSRAGGEGSVEQGAVVPSG